MNRNSLKIYTLTTFISLSMLSPITHSTEAVGTKNTEQIKNSKKTDKTNGLSNGQPYGRWYGALGVSGLRRSIANTSDLGELINRAVTYRLSRQRQLIHNGQYAGALFPPAFEFESEIDGVVAQAGSMKKISSMFGRHTALEGTIRQARRMGDDIDAVSDHIDLGFVWSANWFGNESGYFSLHGVVEQSDADAKFVNGRRKGDSFGGRIQFGEVLNQTWAYSFIAERIWWQGEGYSMRPSALGPIRISQDVEYTRSYVNADVIARYSLPNFIIPNAQFRWRSGIYYLHNDYENEKNNLDLTAREPFGNQERLGFVRTGGHLSWRYGAEKQWSPFTEFMYDYEIQNNMDSVFDDPHTITLKLGVAWLPKLGKRVQLEAQRYQGVDNERARNNVTLTILMDYF